MRSFKKTIIGFMRDDSGATAIEYGLISSLVVVVIITALQNLGNTVLVNIFNKVAGAM